MRKTYAYNSIIFGVLLAILVAAKTDNMVAAVLTGIAVTVVGFIAIRFLENMLYKGASKATDAAVKATKSAVGAVASKLDEHKAQKAAQTVYCPNCGAQLPAGSQFCAKCGTRLG